jgi:hypothetical protein
MTVCIAAVNAFGDIVTASDQMLSMADGAFTAESVALKNAYIDPNWRAMFAAEDVGVVPGLMRQIRNRINWGDRIDVGAMSKILAESFQAERRQRATELYLGSYGIDLPEFMANGANIFGETGAAVIRERIEAHRLGCELLVTGHDPHGVPQIVSVSDPGIVKDHDVAGFWAIGTGWYLALSALAMRGQCSRFQTLKTVYHVCEAKFLAESAVGVGKETFVCVHRKDRSWAAVTDDHLANIRREWLRIGKPRETRTAERLLRHWEQAAKWWDAPSDSKETSSSSDQT